LSKYCWLMKKTIKKPTKRPPKRHSQNGQVQNDLSKMAPWSNWIGAIWGTFWPIFLVKKKRCFLVMLVPFLAFTSSYNVNKVHNMLTIMLDPHFKSLDVVKVFVGWAKVIQIVAKYGNKTLLPLLVLLFIS
jgi:hypothetical protein